MLKQILLKNFKSYRDQILPLAPLTLMIGANASGKSNALEAFRLLSWLTEGQKLSVLQHTINDSDKILRGRIKDLGYLDNKQFTLGCVIDDNSEWDKFELTLEVRDEDHSSFTGDKLHIVQEEIFSNPKKFPLYKITKESTGLRSDIQVSYNNFKLDGRKPQINCTDQIAIMCQLESPATFSRNNKQSQKKIPEIIGYFQKLLTNTLFLDPVPSLMRGDSLTSAKLHNNCSNLAGVLYFLWKLGMVKEVPLVDGGKDYLGYINESQRAHYQQTILCFIQSLPEQDVIDLKFYKDKRRGLITLELIENFGDKKRACPIELLSDGTLRVLAIAAAILSAPKGSTVVIEEVDNGIHPSRVKHLLKTMYQEAKRRNINLLLSTHNPALMDALPDEVLGDVVFCYRDPEEGDSRLTRLSDLDNYAGLIMQSSLGDLVTRGILDRFIKHPVTPEERKKKALKWLNDLNGNNNE
ncbi:MAG: AAA family ATPase [Cocleimonas sp.]|nr:AAA family ATPase [Cocleimonas sp.]